MELPILAQDTNRSTVAIIAGTGSIVLAHNRDGMTVRVGGWGHIVGDEGSGYWLAKQAIEAIMREFDKRGEKTALTKLFLEHLNCNSPQDIIRVIHGEFNKSQFASMAYLLDCAAKIEDRVAIKILVQGATLLFELLQTAITSANFDDEFDIIFIGGVLLKSEIIHTTIGQLVTEQYPNAKMIDQHNEPVDCAVKIASKQRLKK